MNKAFNCFHDVIKPEGKFLNPLFALPISVIVKHRHWARSKMW